VEKKKYQFDGLVFPDEILTFSNEISLFFEWQLRGSGSETNNSGPEIDNSGSGSLGLYNSGSRNCLEEM